MKKFLILLALSLCVVTAFAFSPASVSAEVDAPVKADSSQKVLESRFSNMLNRNYSYNRDFESVDVLAENSIIALLDKRDGEDSDYISDAVVKGFVQDMYGIEIIDINDNTNMHKDGFVYITPRGFTTYNHTVAEIIKNEDGSFTVHSNVKVDPHDDNEYTATAETLFVPNSNSAFCYNIIYSNLTDEASGI